MIQQYRGGLIPHSTGDEGITTIALETIKSAVTLFDEFEFSRGLELIWGLLSAVDKFIVQKAPWKLAKDPAAQDALDLTLYTAAEVLRIVTVLLAPVMPTSTRSIWTLLGMEEVLETVRLDALTWGQLREGQRIGGLATVFPRLEPKEAIALMRKLEAEVAAQQAALLGKTTAPPTSNIQITTSDAIGIEDFAKVDLRVGVVLSAEPVKGADKLLHLKVDIGEPEPRTIVAGIAEAYSPQQMVGRKVVIVANLQPRKLRGITSNGMIVAASLEGGKPVLAGFLEDVPAGARLK
jgi:methionyl-tRNA synthetase